MQLRHTLRRPQLCKYYTLPSTEEEEHTRNESNVTIGAVGQGELQTCLPNLVGRGLGWVQIKQYRRGPYFAVDLTLLIRISG